MKFMSTQVAIFLQNKETSRNFKYLMRFFGLLMVLIVSFSFIFHVIMAWEERDYSWVTGLYWTLTVMSTLGFGDITFVSDSGKIFSIVVLLSGIIFLLVMLPFTFIQFFYAPWLNAQSRSRIPRVLGAEVRDHVLIVGTNPTALALSKELNHYDHRAYLLCPDMQRAIELRDQEYFVVCGEYDDPKTYEALQVKQAAMVVTLESDVRNTGVSFTVRTADKDVFIVSSVDLDESIDILGLSGCDEVFAFTKLLGDTLARRTLAGNMKSGIMGRFGELLVAEAPVMRTPLQGQTLRGAGLRAVTGVNVVGVWERGHFQLPKVDDVLNDNTVLVLVGNRKQMSAFDDYMGHTNDSNAPVLILGGGRVGLAAAQYFERRNIDYRIVEKQPRLSKASASINSHIVAGSAAELEVLEKAGIREAPAVLITTHDDDLNTYLTIYCRRLRPDIQILSRATVDRNINILHAAGADLVMSEASLVANTVLNLLNPGKVLMLSEGLNIFQVPVPTSLVGRTLINSGIRTETNCSVVGVRHGEKVEANPDPAQLLQQNEFLVLIGDSQAEEKFMEHFQVRRNDME